MQNLLGINLMQISKVRKHGSAMSRVTCHPTLQDKCIANDTKAQMRFNNENAVAKQLV